MKVKINLPSNIGREYWGLKDGEIYYFVRTCGDDSLVVDGRPDVPHEVYINPDWCEVVSEFKIELPEDLFDI